MTELGIKLKEAREAKGLSLDDLQRLTKIQKRYLVGIEEGNYDMMPGKFYVRAFIKQYAEAIGIEPEELFEEYKNDIPATYNEDLPQQLSRVKTRKTISPTNSKALEALPKILLAVFVLGAAVLIWVLVSKNVNQPTSDKAEDNNQSVVLGEKKNSPLNKKEKDKAKEDKKQKSEEENKINNDSDVQQPEVKPEIAVLNSSGRDSTYELKNANTFKLKVQSTGTTWVSIKNGQNKVLYQGTLQQNESQEFDLSKETEASLIIGKSTDTDIYVNGEKLQYAIPPAQSVRQDIKIQFKPVE